MSKRKRWSILGMVTTAMLTGALAGEPFESPESFIVAIIAGVAIGIIWKHPK